MQIFQLASAWLLPCAVCTTMALTASAAIDHEHEHSPSPRASSVGGQVSSVGSSPSSTCSLGDQVGFEATSLQRSRTASPRCFGGRHSRQKVAASRAAASKGDVVSALIAADEPKGRRQQRQRQPAANASVSGSSSPASKLSASSTLDRLGFRTSHQSPCFGSKPSRGSKFISIDARSPRKHEEGKGSGVGSYLREISRLLRRGNVVKSPAVTARIARTIRERGRGNIIASEEEMQAFVIASARNIKRNGLPVLPLGLF